MVPTTHCKFIRQIVQLDWLRQCIASAPTSCDLGLLARPTNLDRLGQTGQPEMAGQRSKPNAQKGPPPECKAPMNQRGLAPALLAHEHKDGPKGYRVITIGERSQPCCERNKQNAYCKMTNTPTK